MFVSNPLQNRLAIIVQVGFDAIRYDISCLIVRLSKRIGLIVLFSGLNPGGGGCTTALPSLLIQSKTLSQKIKLNK